MRKFTITTNGTIPTITTLDIHLSQAKAYIATNNLQIIKIEEHIKDTRYPNVVTMKEISREELGL